MVRVVEAGMWIFVVFIVVLACVTTGLSKVRSTQHTTSFALNDTVTTPLDISGNLNTQAGLEVKETAHVNKSVLVSDLVRLQKTLRCDGELHIGGEVLKPEHVQSVLQQSEIHTTALSLRVHTLRKQSLPIINAASLERGVYVIQATLEGEVNIIFNITQHCPPSPLINVLSLIIFFP